MELQFDKATWKGIVNTVLESLYLNDNNLADIYSYLEEQSVKVNLKTKVSDDLRLDL